MRIPTVHFDKPEYTLPDAIAETFRELLSRKHLYQSIEVPEESLERIRKTVREEYQGQHSSHLLGAMGNLNTAFRGHEWQIVPSHLRATVTTPTSTIQVSAPKIKTYCHVCADRNAFVCASVNMTSHGGSPCEQTYFCSYECQGSCSATKVCFMVHREGTKMTLVGRDPFENVEIPKALKAVPKDVQNLFSGAVVEYNSGQTLPGIFMLRSFIEQFWREDEKVKNAIAGKHKVTGDELGEAYKKTLPAGFKSLYPLLTGEYDALSEAIHLAKADPQVFESCRGKIEAHFEALAALKKSKKF